jgi:hypothetical protein
MYIACCHCFPWAGRDEISSMRCYFIGGPILRIILKSLEIIRLGVSLLIVSHCSRGTAILVVKICFAPVSSSGVVILIWYCSLSTFNLLECHILSHLSVSNLDVNYTKLFLAKLGGVFL